MSIMKLSLILEIDEELTEIFKVKGKAQFPNIYRTYIMIMAVSQKLCWYNPLVLRTFGLVFVQTFVKFYF